MAIALWVSLLAGEHVLPFARWRWWSLALFAVVVMWRARRIVVVSCLCLVGISGGAAAWAAPVVTNVAECSGVARLHTDPSPLFGGTQVVLSLHGLRFRATATGVAGSRLAQRAAGESVAVTGLCSPLTGAFARGDMVRHIVGAMNVLDTAELYSEGSIVSRTANRTRHAMQRGVADMNQDNQSLFMGLVVGDDRLQPREMVQRFRDSGLSHLCAASGQNVAYLLAMVSPFIRRRSARVRWLVTMGIIGWFVVLTRAEPSVLRAGVMAGAVATNALRRSPVNARIVLAISVMFLLIVDPMLSWSVGFALSVGATAGLAWLSAPLGKICGGRGLLASTLAAQVGTFPVSFVVFGSVPVISLIANPLALSVAGAVMTIGLPLSLLSAAIPRCVGLVSFGLSLPVAWVDGVARVASHISPPSVLNSVLWCLVVVWVMWRWRVKKRT